MSWLFALLLAGGAELPSWSLMAADSTLTFRAEYDGSPFEGRFEAFAVQLAFDPAAAQGVALDVTVDVTSVDTENRDRDEALAESEWFDFDHYPQAHYQARSLGPGQQRQFRLAGELTLKGITRALPVEFDWSPADGGVRIEGVARMTGGTTLDRMHFDIGTGDWADPELIGHVVTVEFDLLLAPADSGP